MRLHVAYFSDDFRKHLNKLTKRNRALKERILSKIEEMMNNPFRNSQELVGKFKGKRRVHVGRAGYRLIYSICEECREKHYESFNSCLDCKDRSNRTVVFFDVLRRSKGYQKF